MGQFSPQKFRLLCIKNVKSSSWKKPIIIFFRQNLHSIWCIDGVIKEFLIPHIYIFFISNACVCVCIYCCMCSVLYINIINRSDNLYNPIFQRFSFFLLEVIGCMSYIYNYVCIYTVERVDYCIYKNERYVHLSNK